MRRMIASVQLFISLYMRICACVLSISFLMFSLDKYMNQVNPRHNCAELFLILSVGLLEPIPNQSNSPGVQI